MFWNATTEAVFVWAISVDSAAQTSRLIGHSECQFSINVISHSYRPINPAIPEKG